MVDTVNVPVEQKHSRAEPPESYFVPATDIYETADELILVADLPGVKADGLDVMVEDNVLVIRAAPKAREQADGEVLLQEFATGEFYRAFQLPADFDAAKIQATLKQGVLTLRLPKSERLKPRRIEVKAE
jgi:HSP20 family molecular chaperone IbpA